MTDIVRINKNGGAENKAHIAEYARRKKQEDPAYKLISNLRSRVSNLITGKRKKVGMNDALGCTKKELLEHIESQFEEGMTWENYGNGEGQWSIDHIIPFCKIDQTDPNAIMANNHYTNLRPMWHKDNITRKYEEFDEDGV